MAKAKYEDSSPDTTKGKMQQFTESAGFITAFLVFVLFVGMIGGETVLQWFLWLVLIGMVLTNDEKFMGRFF